MVKYFFTTPVGRDSDGLSAPSEGRYNPGEVKRVMRFSLVLRPVVGLANGLFAMPLRRGTQIASHIAGTVLITVTWLWRISGTDGLCKVDGRDMGKTNPHLI